MVGIELEEWSANANDGSIQGKRYFDVEPGKGFFMRKQSYMNLADMINASDFADNAPGNEALRRDSVIIHDVSSILPIEYKDGDRVRLENDDTGVISLVICCYNVFQSISMTFVPVLHRMDWKDAIFPGSLDRIGTRQVES